MATDNNNTTTTTNNNNNNNNNTNNDNDNNNHVAVPAALGNADSMPYCRWHLMTSHVGCSAGACHAASLASRSPR